MQRIKLVYQAANGPQSSLLTRLNMWCAGFLRADTSAIELSELGNALGLLENDSGVVGSSGPGRLTLVHDPGVGKVRYARAATTAFLVAHDVAPFGSVHIPVSIGKR